MPPENNNDTYKIEHHKIPSSNKLEILDFVSVMDSLLLLVKSEKQVNLLQFKAEKEVGYSFTKIATMNEQRHQYIFAPSWGSDSRVDCRRNFPGLAAGDHVGRAQFNVLDVPSSNF